MSSQFLFLTFLTSILTIYLYRSQLQKIGENTTFLLFRNHLEEIEKRKEQEKIYEHERGLKFEKKFPTINKIPFFGRLVDRLYKEGCWYSCGLALIIAIHGYFVLSSLGNHSFFVDELFHALIAKNWFEYHELFKVGENYLYSRGSLVSILAIVSKTIFSNFKDEFAYRLPIALSSMLNVTFIYILSKRVVEKKLALFITLLFATDIWFLEFARYLRFYTPSITIILILLIYVIQSNFSTKSISLSGLFSIIFYLILNEYFLFIGSFFGMILLARLYQINKRIFYLFSFLFMIAGLIAILFRIIQMGSYMETYNFLNYNLYSFTYTIAHIKWLALNYWYALIGIFLSLPVILKSFNENIRGNFKNLEFLLLFNLYNYAIIFGIMDHVQYNFTFRPFLFILPISILVSIVLISANYISQNRRGLRKYFLFFMLILIIPNIIILLSYHSCEYGARFYPYKLVFEHQPLIIDTKTPNVFVENYIHENNISDYSIFVVALNEYPFTYYTDMDPDYLVRWKGSSVDGMSRMGTPMIWDPLIFSNKIKSENARNHVFIIGSAEVYRLRNPLYKVIYNRDYAAESPESITKTLESDLGKYQIYVGKDNISRVYYIPVMGYTSDERPVSVPVSRIY